MKKNNLSQNLINLIKNSSVIGIKGGTEVEDLSFKELKFLRKLTKGKCPLTVKIGGPEARNDIRFLLEYGIDKALAPMIESVYGLKNFVESALELENYYGRKIEKAINIETITAYKNIDEMFASPFFKEIKSITVGRTDLSGSMGMNVDDPEVISITKDIVKKAREKGKATSVGGKITVNNIEMIKNEINPDCINTRHIIYDLSKMKDARTALQQGIYFEVELFKAFRMMMSAKKKFYDLRIKDNVKRAGN